MNSESTALLEVVAVSRVFDRGSVPVHALRNVSLSAREGSYIAIVGASGCGKSTLLHQLGLLDRPTSGEVFVNGKPSSGFSDEELAGLRRTHLGFVFQFFQLLPALSAWENVALPGVLDGRRVSELRERAELLLAGVGLGARSTHLPSELSGGEQQRVAIARSLFADPIVVLADEPTGALDTATSMEVLKLLEESTVDSGKALVVVTHDSEVADRALTRLTMRDGAFV